MNAAKRLPVIAVFLLFLTCSNPVKDLTNQFDRMPEIPAIVRAIKASTTLGYAANSAMDAIVNRPGPGVSVSRDADSFPCNAIVSIAVSKAHPLPVGGDSTGTMRVVGFWPDSQTALMTVFFTNTNVADGTFILKNVAFVPVTRDTGGTTVVFASEDVNADSATVVTTKITDSMVTVKLAGVPDALPTDSALAVNQKAWITVVKEPKASYSLGSETYDLYGASQYLGVSPSTIEVIQAVMVAVEMSPGVCRRNPVSGYAMIRDMKIQGTNSDIELGTTLLSFANTCNGSAKIPLATGVYLGRTGSAAALNLDE
jgi:hypothetical protein